MRSGIIKTKIGAAQTGRNILNSAVVPYKVTTATEFPIMINGKLNEFLAEGPTDIVLRRKDSNSPYTAYSYSAQGWVPIKTDINATDADAYIIGSKKAGNNTVLWDNMTSGLQDHLSAVRFTDYNYPRAARNKFYSNSL